MPKRIDVDAVLEGHVREFVTMIPGVRDGDSEAIHAARTATRRVRAALEIVTERYQPEEIKRIRVTVQRASRALGRARDLDVLLELVADLERKTSAAGTAALPLRHQLFDEQRTGRQTLLTKIDALPLRSLPHALSQARKDAWFHLWHPSAPTAETFFRERLAARVGKVRRAVEAASGIYLPETAHRARIAIRKLHYLLELGETARLWHAVDAIKPVKRAQRALGEARDRHLLIDRLNQIDGSEFMHTVSIAKQLLDAERQDYYGKYVQRRGNLLEVCTRIEARLHPSSFLKRHRNVLAAALVAPAALVAGRASSGYLTRARSSRHAMNHRVTSV